MNLKNELLEMTNEEFLYYINEQSDKGFVIWEDIQIIEDQKHHIRKGVLTKNGEKLNFIIEVNINETIQNLNISIKYF